jgi:hypothetical protein
MNNKELVYEDNTVVDSIVLEDDINKNMSRPTQRDIKRNEDNDGYYNEEDNEEELNLITKKMVEIESEVYKVYTILDKYRKENNNISDILKYLELKDVYKMIYPDYDPLF